MRTWAPYAAIFLRSMPANMLRNSLAKIHYVFLPSPPTALFFSLSVCRTPHSFHFALSSLLLLLEGTWAYTTDLPRFSASACEQRPFFRQSLRVLLSRAFFQPNFLFDPHTTTVELRARGFPAAHPCLFLSSPHLPLSSRGVRSPPFPERFAAVQRSVLSTLTFLKVSCRCRHPSAPIRNSPSLHWGFWPRK